MIKAKIQSLERGSRVEGGEIQGFEVVPPEGKGLEARARGKGGEVDLLQGIHREIEVHERGNFCQPDAVKVVLHAGQRHIAREVESLEPGTALEGGEIHQGPIEIVPAQTECFQPGTRGEGGQVDGLEEVIRQREVLQSGELGEPVEVERLEPEAMEGNVDNIPGAGIHKNLVVEGEFPDDAISRVVNPEPFNDEGAGFGGRERLRRVHEIPSGSRIIKIAITLRKRNNFPYKANQEGND